MTVRTAADLLARHKAIPREPLMAVTMAEVMAMTGMSEHQVRVSGLSPQHGSPCDMIFGRPCIVIDRPPLGPRLA